MDEESVPVQLAQIKGQLHAQDAVLARQDNLLEKIAKKLEDMPGIYVSKEDHVSDVKDVEDSVKVQWRMIVGGFAAFGIALIAGLFVLFGDVLPLLHR
jgi:hypothetical protein